MMTVLAGKRCAPEGIRTPNLLIRRPKFTHVEQDYLGIRGHTGRRSCLVSSGGPLLLGQRLDSSAPARSSKNLQSQLTMHAAIIATNCTGIRGSLLLCPIL